MSFVLPIEEDPRFRRYTASQGQQLFSIPFPFQQNEDVSIQLFSDGAYTEIDRTQFVISGAMQPTGGNVVFNTGRTAGEIIVVVGAAVLDRLSSITRDGRFSSKLTDDELDRNRIIQQEQQRDLDRSIKAPFGTMAPTFAATGPSNLLSVNASGAIVSSETPANEKELREAADNALASLIGQAGEIEVAFYDTRVSLSLATVKPTRKAVITAGHLSPGDEPMKLFIEVDEEPSSGDREQSADGRWWRGVPNYDGQNSLLQLANGYTPQSTQSIRLEGRGSSTDKAGGLVRKVLSEPSHFGKRQDGSGEWWEYLEEDDRLRTLSVAMFAGESIVIDCYGDSTMVGVDVTNPPTYIAATPAPAKLQLFLRDYYANGNIVVNNRAFSGTRTINMLEGSDGSGQTFEARIAASPAHIVYCNHGINDCQNTPPTPIGDYKANLYEIVRIIRAYGKIPVLMTPNLISPVGPLGTIDKSERLKSYAEVVREVCRTARVALVDAFEQISQLLTCGNYTVQQILPDGVHPTQTGYNYIGQLMAAPYVYPYQGVSADGEIVSVASPLVICTPSNAPTEAKNSRSGMQFISTADNVPKSIRMLVKVEKPGLDLYVGYPIWGGGVSSAGIALDQISIGTMSQYHNGNYGTRYIQDHETCVARNVPPGLHMVTISAAAQAASVGVNYLRVKKASPIEKRFSNGSPFLLTRKGVLEQASLTVSNGSTNGIVLTDTIQFDRLLSGFDFSFTGQLAKGEAICVFGEWAADSSGGIAVMALGIGADEATGYLTVFQATGDGTYNKTALNALDITLQEREFRVVMGQGSGSSLNVFLDGGGPYGPTAISSPFLGGFFGLRRSGNGTMNVKKLQTLQ